MIHLLQSVHEECPLSDSFVKAEVNLSAHGILKVDYSLRSPAASYANPALSGNASQDGLWNWDVVELFLSVLDPNSPMYHYTEFQVSPLGQRFHLRVFEPRKRFDGHVAVNWVWKAERDSDRDWRASLQIPLVELGWTGDPSLVRGGLFSILGRPGEKSYWSAFLPRQEVPDFHLPEMFRPLI